jgi:Ribbon-helix-helix protein, copG family
VAVLVGGTEGLMPANPTTRTAVIAFHITEAEKAAIERAAADRGVSVAALMREAVELRRRFSDADVALILGRPSSPAPPEPDQG